MKTTRSKIKSETGRSLGYTLYMPETAELAEVGGKHQIMIYSHGFKGFSSWGFIPYVCQQHAERGIIAVALDFSMNGIVDEQKMTYDAEVFAANTVSAMLAELHLLIDHLKDELKAYFKDHEVLKSRTNELDFTLAGHSLGAALSLVVAAEREDIKNLVLWGSVGTLDRNTERQKQLWKEKGRIEFKSKPGGQKLWQNYSYLEDKEAMMDRITLVHRAAEYNGNLLVIHGEADVTTRLKEGQQLYEAAKSSRNNTDSRKATLLPIPKAGHTFNSFHPMQKPPPEPVAKATAAMVDAILG